MTAAAIGLTAYVLVFPVIVLGVLLTIATSFFKELAEARRKGESII